MIGYLFETEIQLVFKMTELSEKNEKYN